MKFNADQAQADRRASIARLAAIRNQITADQQTDAKRDAKALAREAAWLKKYDQAK